MPSYNLWLGSDLWLRERELAGRDEGARPLDVAEHGLDIHAAVARPVRPESARRLLQLALAPRPVAPTRVVPGDGDVDESLEEIAFGRRCVEPLFLELLMSFEVRLRADQVEAVLEAHDTIIGVCEGCYCRPVATILLVGVDLFFRGRLEGLLPGHRFVTTDSVHAPDLVIADIARVEPEEVVDAWPDIPIVGFTNHTDRSGLQRAHTAGFDQVIVKSALVERAPELVARLTAVT